MHLIWLKQLLKGQHVVFKLQGAEYYGNSTRITWDVI